MRSTCAPPYEPDAEYVDGIIEERAVSERDQALWQKAILRWFSQHEKEWSVEVWQELRVQVSATRYRVPDVTMLDRGQPSEQIITSAPLAVFEVLSPEDALQRLKRRLEDYTAMSSFYRYQDRQLLRNKSFVHAAKGISFDMNEIKTLLD